MSRIGRKPIPVPQGVKVAIEGQTVRAEGPKGKLSQAVPGSLAVTVAENVLTVTRTSGILLPDGSEIGEGLGVRKRKAASSRLGAARGGRDESKAAHPMRATAVRVTS